MVFARSLIVIEGRVHIAELHGIKEFICLVCKIYALELTLGFDLVLILQADIDSFLLNRGPDLGRFEFVVTFNNFDEAASYIFSPSLRQVFTFRVRFVMRLTSLVMIIE